jgi:glutamine amidotransferase
MFGILDYGVGNIRSIANMLDYLNIDNIFVKNSSDFAKVQKLILPGIGSFDYAMSMLNKLNLVEDIHKFVLNKNNLLIGICLGMQLLGKTSKEGQQSGLGLIDFDVLSLKDTSSKNIPNMGWRDVIIDSSLKTSLFEHNKFYFVHSFYVPLAKNHKNYSTIMKTSYDFDYSAAIKKDKDRKSVV